MNDFWIIAMGLLSVYLSEIDEWSKGVSGEEVNEREIFGLQMTKNMIFGSLDNNHAFQVGDHWFPAKSVTKF